MGMWPNQGHSLGPVHRSKRSYYTPISDDNGRTYGYIYSWTQDYTVVEKLAAVLLNTPKSRPMGSFSTHGVAYNLRNIHSNGDLRSLWNRIHLRIT